VKIRLIRENPRLNYIHFGTLHDGMMNLMGKCKNAGKKLEKVFNGSLGLKSLISDTFLPKKAYY